MRNTPRPVAPAVCPFAVGDAVRFSDHGRGLIGEGAISGVSLTGEVIEIDRLYCRVLVRRQGLKHPVWWHWDFWQVVKKPKGGA